MKQPGKVYLIDTNIILRYLLEDHEEYSPRAKAFMMDISKGTKKLRYWMLLLLNLYMLWKSFTIFLRMKLWIN